MLQNLSRGERPHIVLYGEVNSGKSTLFNLLIGQDVSVVSAIAGTTTDAVSKSIELPGVGPVVLIDTPGVCDDTPLGAQRMLATERALRQADIVLCTLPEGGEVDTKLKEKYASAVFIPLIASHDSPARLKEKVLSMIAQALAPHTHEQTITGALAKVGDLVLLVMPQDKSAPKGRLILPQVQTIRELLDKGCQVLCTQPSEYTTALSKLTTLPDLVITDSQVFVEVEALTPQGVPLTSFSVLMSAYKGSLPELLEGARALGSLSSNARILIAEACSHAPTTEDIGRVKLPNLLWKKLGDGLDIVNVNGNDFPENLSGYDLIIHCGACMFNRQHLVNRQALAKGQSIPMTNYGIAIAQLVGILDRIALPLSE